MSWNHRVIEGSDGVLAVHEVQYDPEHRVIDIGQDPVIADGTTLEKLRLHMASMQRAADLPVLTRGDVYVAPVNVAGPGNPEDDARFPLAG